MKSRARSTRRNRTLRPFADIAGAQPAVLVLDGARCVLVVPIALEQIGAAHQDLAVFGKLHVPASGSGADISGPRKLSALAGDDAARVFRLAVNLHNVDAVHLPKRHRLGRQRRAAADDELQAIEAELVENRAKDRRMAGAVAASSAPVAGRPSSLRMTARQPHREFVARALQLEELAMPTASVTRTSASSAAR